MLTVKAGTLMSAWEKLNWKFITLPESEGMHIPTRDYTRVTWPVRLSVTRGFGFDGSDHEDLHGFFKDYSHRIKLLHKRYIDPELWEEGMLRLQARAGKLSSRNPLSFIFQFHRRRTSERKVPAGGGCLSQIVFVWFQGKWGLHVTLRASEITASLMGDFVFVHYLVDRIRNEVNLKHFDPDNLEIFWDIALASQMKAIVPLFILYTRGDMAVLDWMYRNPKEIDNPWEANVVQHFWDTFLHPDRISWGARRRWTNRFYEVTEIDWQVAYKKWSKEYADLS